MTHRHFCTYFDHRYLARGLALHHSLSKVCPEFTLWVLALSQEAVCILEKVALKNLKIVPLSALEHFDPELLATRTNRSVVEYYFTCSPCLPRYLLTLDPGMMAITYLDSDLFFFSSPEPVFAELEPYSVGITPHRFSPTAAKSHARFGKYNVGWLTFRRDDAGLACLEWWRDRCIEWCFDRLEGDRYADQKYLEQFEALFPSVHSIIQPGANLAPWNVAGYTVSYGPTQLEIDGQPLIFFHFQGLRRLSNRIYDSNLTGYGARLTNTLRKDVFRPYLASLQEAEALAEVAGAKANETSGIRRRARGFKGLRYAAGRLARTIRSAMNHNLVRL
ncbi:MAG: hypothetical protein ABI114_11240 [Rhodanobacter sp.]